ncbi:amidohydrolase [Acidisphaera sp. L21]|uniref:amidohydrolase family protein n=1 Tax=Acidisphaera sp. L21 TaxID=1641851 RepID=UPI00131B7C7B|nr:amidohydrolase family protein [Acidisphaera sp. L21]
MLTRRTLVAAGVAVATTRLHAAPLPDMPPGACDCHVHIIGPQDRYPMVADRAYTPGQSTVGELLALRKRLGLSRTVLVQPSFYGTDNGSLLDALGQLGDTARGIAVLEPNVTDDVLKRLDKAGIRGVRLNIETGGGRDPRDITRPLGAFAKQIAPLGWHIQIYAALSVIARVAPDVANLAVPVVFDHFGMPDAALGPDQPGFPVLLDLVRSGKAYVKLSAPYRISKQPGYADVTPIARALIAAGPERMVWASDWPHTDHAPGKGPAEISPFRAVDDSGVLDLLATWCPDPAARRTILATTPQRLYRFS